VSAKSLVSLRRKPQSILPLSLLLKKKKKTAKSGERLITKMDCGALCVCARRNDTGTHYRIAPTNNT
jgi:hypothetical protein